MEQSNVMLGFGKALASLILAFIALFICISSLEFSAIVATDWDADLLFPILFFLFAFAISIVSLCMGISSISTFRHTHSKNGRPVPSLVLGINSVVLFAFNALILLLNLFVLFADLYTKIT